MKNILIAFLTMMCSLATAGTITFVVPYPAGGDTDVLARIFATKYTELTGKSTVVENRVGASGIIGFNYVKSAPNDGSVIALVPSTFVTAPYFFSAATYDPLNDFTPIMQLGGHGFFIIANSSTGIKTVKELIAANKQGKINNYGSPGVGTPQNILGEMFNLKAGTNITHIPFKGNAEIVNNMLNNTVDITINSALAFRPHVESGRMTIIASAGAQRSPLYPDVPTLAEQGIPGIEFESWLGFVGPKGMSTATVNEFNRVFNEIIKLPDVQERLKTLAMIPAGSSPSAFRQKIANNQKKFSAISKSLNIKAQ